MRIRNVKNKEEILDNSKFLVKNPKDNKGKWNKVFNNDNPIYIEIGMGKGKFIIENAKKYPNINFIGIEKYDSVIVRAIEKLENLDLPNLKLIKMDATNIETIFNKEIDLIYLNFSDPWPKLRHEKRRLSSFEFLKKYDNIFKNNKRIIMKTDNRKLFEYSIISYTNYGYKINDISLDLYNDDVEDNIPTEYEIKFKNKGLPIYKIDVEK
jgi:tRNA (guanine-N7-)-methyltransferase